MSAPLFVNFVDFRKAFDNIHLDTLWAVIRYYDLSQKIVSLIKFFLRTISVWRFSEGRRFWLLRSANMDETGLYALFYAYSFSIDNVVRIDNEGSQAGKSWGISSGQAKPGMPLLIYDQYGGHRSNEPSSILRTASLNLYCCTDRSVGKLLKRVRIHCEMPD